MQANRSKDTKPELAVRRILHAMGYRFRLHRRDLPGKPDIVFPGRRKIIEVRGCYWHGHGCRIGKPARSNLNYWQPKIARNRERDSANLLKLESDGWGVLEMWECEVRAAKDLETSLAAFLGPPCCRYNL